MPEFECDRSSLLQIFLNLAENAVTAMASKGILRIEVFRNQTDQVTITVSDTGKGISPEELPKIFEPFYTSRSDRWGAGLGLAITYGLIQEMGGDISVRSVVGKGTRFTLTLPVKPTRPPASDGALHLPRNDIPVKAALKTIPRERFMSPTSDHLTDIQFFGTLAAAMTHDMKNFLAIVNENAGLLADLAVRAQHPGVPIDPLKAGTISEKIGKQVARADTLMKRFNRSPTVWIMIKSSWTWKKPWP